MINRDIEKIVSVTMDKSVDSYPQFPFSPPEIYPEFKSSSIFISDRIDADNKIYTLIRKNFIKAGLDKENIGTASWSPFRNIIKKGNCIVIKPNLVFHEHPLGEIGFLSMVTHASVIRPVIDYILLETGADVHIVIGDASLQSTDINMVIEKNGVKQLIELYKGKGIDISFADLRYVRSIIDEEGIICRSEEIKADPLGYARVDLKNKSAFIPIINYRDKLEITDYPSGSVPRHHNNEKNEYLIAKTVLDNDVFINIPKLKTHKKAGITVAMKNLIGINGDKSWIAHHRRGSKSSGGDEYDKFNLSEFLKWRINAALKRTKLGSHINKILRRVYRRFFWHGKSVKEMGISEKICTKFMEGSWHGNDTVWRTILDLNNIILFSDKDGRLHDEPQRRYICIVDGILAGERNGPMEQIPKKTGIIITGFNPVAVDYLAAKVMGFDYKKIPQINNGFKNENFPLAPCKPCDIVINSDYDIDKEKLRFIPPDGWLKAL